MTYSKKAIAIFTITAGYGKPVDDEHMNRLINNWHNGVLEGSSVFDAMGLTPEQYGLFVEDEDAFLSEINSAIGFIPIHCAEDFNKLDKRFEFSVNVSGTKSLLEKADELHKRLLIPFVAFIFGNKWEIEP